MVNRIQILVAGNHEKIMEILIRHINNNENWSAMPTFTSDEAKLAFGTRSFDIVLLSSGFKDYEEQEMIKFFKVTNPRAEIVLHFGGGTGLLFNEINAAIDSINSKQ